MEAREAPEEPPWPGISVHVDDERVATLLIDQPRASVNLIDLTFVEDLETALSTLPPDVAGLIVTSGKREQFVAGANLRLVLAADRPVDAEEVVRRLQRALNRLAALPYPSVAAINGPALGGGFELALACDYRVCAESNGRILGLPEVQLGLLPAAGGTQRLPSLIGLSRSLGLILQARTLSSRQALASGLVDDVVHPAVLIPAARSWMPRGKRKAHPPWSLLDRAAARSALVRSVVYRRAAASVRARTGGQYPAPAMALDTVRAGQEQGFGAGLGAAAVAFGELATGEVSHNLIRLFLATEALKGEQRQLTERARAVDRVGVVGAGFMGAGIAQGAAAAGYSVRLRDVTVDRVAAGLRSVRRITSGGARKGRFTRLDAAELLTRVSGTTDYSGFGRTQLVIEAVFEDVEIKRAVIGQLDDVLAADAVIASNTSSLPIAALAAGASRPDRIVGMHFFSPVHRMPLVEVIRAPATSDEAVAIVVAVARRLGKTAIVVRDGPGFYTTRVLAFMLQEAGQIFEEGASVEDIDGAMTSFGFPVGPLALLDEVGIDVAAHIAKVLAGSFPHLRPARTVQILAERGLLGRKSGKGFYDYTGRRKRPNTAVSALRGGAVRKFPRQLMQRRLVLACVNEAARCLGERIIACPRDGDVGAVLGFGFPPFLGGPFRYADRLGAERVVAELDELAQVYGDRFLPAPALSDLAARGGRLYEEKP